ATSIGVPEDVLAAMALKGFKTGPAGELPLDIHVKQILDGPELKWMLMPLPKRAAGKPATEGPAKPSNDADPKRNKAEPNKTKQVYTKDEDHLVAASRKRGTAAVKVDDSRPCEPVAKRKRLVTGVAKLKVQAANRLYSFARRVISLCVDLDIPVICENPRRSLMWKTDYFSDLPSVCRFQHIHSCMYGGKRKKRTSFLLNFHAQNLLLECDDKHQHLPWGLVQDDVSSEIKFSTSLETEYPAGLCKQLASAFLDRMLQQGKDIAQTPLQMEQAQRMGSGLQPRGGRAPLLLGDFKFKIDVTSENVDIPSQISESVHPPFQGIPIHSKLISSRYVSEVGDEGEKRTRSISTFGVFRSPFEFLHRALTLEHPLDNPHNVDKCNLKAILFIRDHSASEVVQFRAKQLKKYTSRAAQLGAEELQFKKTLDGDVARVLEGKRLLLFKEMAVDANVGDETLFQELTEGFRLTGEMPQSKQFPAKLKPALISVQQLRESSVWAKKMIHSSCRRVGADPEIAKAVFEETQQQLKDGWVRGPFSAADLDLKYNGCWVPSKRFGVRQGGKIRAVDDFSEFLINASVTSTEKLQLFGLDEVVNTARTFIGCDFLRADDLLENLWCDPAVRFFKGPWTDIMGSPLVLLDEQLKHVIVRAMHCLVNSKPRRVEAWNLKDKALKDAHHATISRAGEMGW
ncbi:unnamed protein product, partial [Cladocopium goreaui]